MGKKPKAPREPRPRTIPLFPGWLPAHRVVPDVRAVGLAPEAALAVILALRYLRSWTEATPEERPTLFAPLTPERSAALAPESAPAGLVEPLRVIRNHRADPASIPPARLAAACVKVHQWADRRGRTWMAALFADAAARVDPADPSLARAAGRAARRVPLPERAEVWYERAQGLAARQGSRGEIVRALLGRGALLRELGRHDEARLVFQRASRLAAGTRRHRLAAETEHELLIIAAEIGDYQDAEHHMRAALRHYPVHHPYFPILVHDWCFLIVRYGLYEQAFPLLEAVIPQVRRLELQALAWGTLGRAAAGAGRRGRYEEAKRQALNLVESYPEYAAAVFANLAEGARFFGAWNEGKRLAKRALKIARARREESVRLGTRTILRSLCARQVPAPQAAPPRHNHLEEIHRTIVWHLRTREKSRRRPIQLDPDSEAGGQKGHPPAGEP